MSKMKKGPALYEKAKGIIPGGTQLLSKRPEMFLPDHWPAYYDHAKGCEIWDLDGDRYVDASLMSAGTNILGYAFDPVDNAAVDAIRKGGISTLNAPEEIELAELMLSLHPWADMARYAKAGGESMALAVRVARAHTRKDIVLVCGYHGWHDWYLAANLTGQDQLAGVHLAGLEPLGVPRNLAGSNHIFHYNRYDEFEALLNAHRGNIAAVVMEPIRNDYPEDDFLGKIRAATRAEGIVLLFDEISAGFRLCCGGSHLVLGVEPDMAVFAKSMANGYPAAIILGKRDVMSAAEDTFISSTFWTERVSLAAAVATITYYRDHQVEKHLEAMGRKAQEGWAALGKKHGLAISTGGIYPLSHFGFEYPDALAHKTYFTQEMLKEGYLASTAFYMSLAHTEAVMDAYLSSCDRVFAKVADLRAMGESIEAHLEGPVCHAGFQRLN